MKIITAHEYAMDPHGPCRVPCERCDAIWHPGVTWPHIDDPIQRRLFVMNQLDE